MYLCEFSIMLAGHKLLGSQTGTFNMNTENHGARPRLNQIAILVVLLIAALLAAGAKGHSSGAVIYGPATSRLMALVEAGPGSEIHAVSFHRTSQADQSGS